MKISLAEYWELQTCLELPPDQADLIHDQYYPWVFLFTLPNGNKLRVPRHLASLERVPTPWRPLLKSYLCALPADLLESVLSGCPDPWQDYDPELWGQEAAERYNPHRRATRSLWNQRMQAAGLSSLWLTLQSLMRSGCLHPETLLQHALLSSPSASQMIALFQVLNEVYEKGYPEGPRLPWSTGILPDVRWEAPALWGELRSALNPLDAERVIEVLCGVMDLSKGLHLSGVQDPKWGAVLQQMCEYATPTWLKSCPDLWPDHAYLFFPPHEDTP